MAIDKYDELTNEDLNVLINKVNAEIDRRFYGAVSKPAKIPTLSDSSVAKTTNPDLSAVKSRLNSINAHHCSCEVHSGRDRGTNSGTIKTIDYDVQTKDALIKPTEFSELNQDITELSAQCSCNSNTDNRCSCDNHCNCQSNCTCDDVCNCNTQCSCQSVCNCNQVCSCNMVSTGASYTSTYTSCSSDGL
jgi:hypothetical protein